MENSLITHNIFPRIRRTRSYPEDFHVGPVITELYVPVFEIKVQQLH